VTSRDHLTGLVATAGAYPLSLKLLTDGEAHQLLVRRLGEDRVTAEPEAVAEIITRCAGLPLALAIVAAHAAVNVGFALSGLPAELREAHFGLDGFTADDTAVDIRTVFSWSYRTLGERTARLFRLLGLHPGPDLTPPAAAALAGLPPAEVRPLLAELGGANLITEHTPGRYVFHDLLRAYAIELANAREGPTARRVAVHRLLDHYLHTAHCGAMRLNPPRQPITLSPPQLGADPQDLPGHREAMAWFTAEHRVLLAATRSAFDLNFNTHAWQLAWTLTDFLDRHGLWDDWIAVERIAVRAAQRLRDRSAHAHAYRSLGVACSRTGRYPEAQTCLRQALDLFTIQGDRAGQAYTHRTLAYVIERQGRREEALDHDLRALGLFRVLNDRPGQARALNAVGWGHAQLGDPGQGLEYCQQALSMLQNVGDRRGEAATWDSLGYIHRSLGAYQQAVLCYQQALGIIRTLGDRYEEACMLTQLGDVHTAAGEPDAARNAWQRALTILDQLGHPDAETLRAKLADVQPAGGARDAGVHHGDPDPVLL
jgi:tetratricopeptide (TPR) repeat protein